VKGLNPKTIARIVRAPKRKLFSISVTRNRIAITKPIKKHSDSNNALCFVVSGVISSSFLLG